MALKDLLGELYKENMTTDEIETALADKTFIDPATLPKTVAKEQFDKTASELAKIKKELSDKAAESLSAEQRAKLAIDEANAAKADYLKRLSKLKAEEILKGAGLTETDYSEIIDKLVSEDEESTVKTATAFSNIISTQKMAAQKAREAELLKNTPNTPNGTPPPAEPTEAPTDPVEYRKWREKQN
jgi:hypothetical protein